LLTSFRPAYYSYTICLQGKDPKPINEPEVEVYQVDPSLVDEYGGEDFEEDEPLENLEKETPEPTEKSKEATYELSLVEEPVVEEQLEEENLDTATRTLPEEIMEESQIIESSPKIQEQEESIKDLISLNQYPQDEPPSIVPIEDLSL